MIDDPIGGSGDMGGGGGPGLVAAAAAAQEEGRPPTRRRCKRRGNGLQEPQPQQQLEPAAAAAAAVGSVPGGLKLPPGVAPVSDFTSVFCSVSAVALTLLATTLPYAGGTHDEEREIHKGLMFYFLWCAVDWMPPMQIAPIDRSIHAYITLHEYKNTHAHSAITVLLFFFKMQSSLEHAVILLALDQLMLMAWLLALVLLPGAAQRRYTRSRHRTKLDRPSSDPQSSCTASSATATGGAIFTTGLWG